MEIFKAAKQNREITEPKMMSFDSFFAVNDHNFGAQLTERWSRSLADKCR